MTASSTKLASESAARPAGQPVGFVQGLGLWDSTMIVVGSMIGSGIYIVSADISRVVQSPALLLIVWLVSGVMTMIGALSYGELAAAMPTAGGQYIYLRESLGPLWGFLYGWTMLLVIQTATIAAVGIAFSKFAGVFVPWFSSSAWLWQMGTYGPYHFWFGNLGPYNVGLNQQNLLAIVSILVLTAVNTRGLRVGAVVQNIFTVAKTGALAGLILLGLLAGREGSRITNLSNFWGHGGGHFYTVAGALVPIGTMALVGVAMVGALFSSDAWNNITFLAAEVKEPKKNLPAALAMGTMIVCALYLLANVAYLNVLPFEGEPAGVSTIARGIQYAAEDRVGTAVAGMIVGNYGAYLMAAAIMVSTFGCNNGLILAGARIYYAMSRDGLFFRGVGNLNRFRVPGAALVVQGIWASVLCLSGSYSQLLDFLIFAVLVFYILTIGGLIVLRFRRPEMERPYRAFGYPYLPLLYLVMALFIEVQLLRYKPEYTWPGLILVVLGIPVYWLWRWLGTGKEAESS
jgi:APA family basic amino acid/polyamine antiporter